MKRFTKVIIGLLVLVILGMGVTICVLLTKDNSNDKPQETKQEEKEEDEDIKLDEETMKKIVLGSIVKGNTTMGEICCNSNLDVSYQKIDNQYTVTLESDKEYVAYFSFLTRNGETSTSCDRLTIDGKAITDSKKIASELVNLKDFKPEVKKQETKNNTTTEYRECQECGKMVKHLYLFDYADGDRYVCKDCKEHAEAKRESAQPIEEEEYEDTRTYAEGYEDGFAYKYSQQDAFVDDDEYLHEDSQYCKGFNAGLEAGAKAFDDEMTAIDNNAPQQ